MAVVIKPTGPMIGLDIGSSQIKAVEARATRDGIQITGLAVVPTPDDLYVSGTIIDPKALGLFIKQLMSEHKFAAKRVVSAIGGQSTVVVRIVEMSKMSDQELKDTMKWEVERHVPFAASDVEMDFVPIPNPTAAADAQTMEVLLVVAQREALNLHLEVLDAAGLQPTAIDVGPLAAARALIDAGDPAFQNEIVGVVNIGATTTDISIFRHGTLAFTRPMPLAGDTFTRAVADALSKTTEEAEVLKREHGRVMLLETGAARRPLELDAAPAPETTQIAPPANSRADLRMPLSLLDEPEPPTADLNPVVESTTRPAFDLSDDDDVQLPAQSYSLDAPPTSDAAGQVSGDAPEPAPDSIFDLESISPLARNLGNGPVIIRPGEETDKLSLAGLDLNEQVFHAIQPVLADFVTELRRSLDYFSSRTGGEGISKIILCGGGARLPNLDTYLAQELNIVVDVPALGPMIQSTYNSFTAEDLQNALTVLPVSLGLAIRDMVDEEAPPRAASQKGKAA